MRIFPPIPTFENLHPLIVHFPIALLLTAPVFLVLAGAWHSRRREMLTSALILTVLGTLGAAAATWTGDAAEDAAGGAPAGLVHRHEELAELARNLFIGVTAVLGIAAAFVWKRGARMGRKAGAVLASVLLVLYAAPALVLANAAHLGGSIAHGASGPTGAGTPTAAVSADRDD